MKRSLTVADHYNAKKGKGVVERQYSPLFRLFAFNNWVKSVLIGYYVPSKGVVLDLCCGKGGDLFKFVKAAASHVVGVDIAAASVEESITRYNALFDRQPPPFSAAYLVADCCHVDLDNTFDKQLQFDVVNCQFALHYSFESEERARTLLKNASSRLKPGGYFIGTITDAKVLQARHAKVKDGTESFGNAQYSVTFDHDTTQASPYGRKYTFWLEGAIDSLPEYLVPLETFEVLAKEYGLVLEETWNFQNFFETYGDAKAYPVYHELMRKMKAVDMSPDEWEIAHIYRTFVFVKHAAHE
jgi:mRNA (guanine-N7-)-methyltransferase